MSFFGFEDNAATVEKEKQKFRDGHIEDVAVYTWGEDSYDGLGDALQEDGDDLIDETFGGSGAVGKDFDFSSQAIPDDAPKPSKTETAPASISRAAQPPAPAPNRAIDSIWDDKSAASVLGGLSGTSSASYGIGVSAPSSHQGIHSLAEIEAEMRAQALHARTRELAEEEKKHRAAQLQAEEELMMRQQALQQKQMRQEQMYQEQLQRERLEQEQNYLRQRQQPLPQQLNQDFAKGPIRTPPPRLQQNQSPRFQSPHQQPMNQQQRAYERAQAAQLQEHAVIEHQRIAALQQRRRHELEQIQQQRSQQEFEQMRRAQLEMEMEEKVQMERMEQLQHQLQMEELARQMQNQRVHDGRFGEPQMLNIPPPSTHSQHTSGSIGRDLHYRGSPGISISDAHLQNALQQLPQNVALQQRLIAEVQQAEIRRGIPAATPQEQDVLRLEAMRKILAAEQLEEKRRRRLNKIASMSRYNDLMTQSDKDFITRIQVSQLITQDPYAEDFYAQVYTAIKRSRMGVPGGPDDRGGRQQQQRGGRGRQNALQRMEAQVERIVNNARLREKEKGQHSLQSLQGALGKTSGRSYKAAPRQLLQVESGPGVSISPTLSHAQAHGHISKVELPSVDGAAQEAAKLGREALGIAAHEGQLEGKDPLTRRQALIKLEEMYETVLQLEQLRRDQPPPEDEVATKEWEDACAENVKVLWDELMVDLPIQISDPHPFVSLLSPTKGKKLLPRLSRHLSAQQMLTMLTLLTAVFSQLDVVRQAPLLDSLEETTEVQAVERETQAFLGSVLQSILPVVAKASLRVVTGLLGLLVSRSDVTVVGQSRPGLAMLTLLLSRVEVIKQSMASTTDPSEVPTPEDAHQWQTMFDHLFRQLTPFLVTFLPSVRLQGPLAQHPDASIHGKAADVIDQPVWQFLASVALHASPEQQQVLVTRLREKVLDEVRRANHGMVATEEERRTKLSNVNLFLHALGLDSSQITL